MPRVLPIFRIRVYLKNLIETKFWITSLVYVILLQILINHLWYESLPTMGWQQQRQLDMQWEILGNRIAKSQKAAVTNDV